MKSKLISGILLVLSCCYWNLCPAQLNEADTIKFQLRSSISGNYQEGNVEFLSVRGKLDFSFVPNKIWVVKSQNSSLYQAFFNRKADSDLFSRNYLYYKTQHRFYPFGIAYISANFRRKINWRYFAGAGITCKVWHTDRNDLKISASAVYEDSHFAGKVFNVAEYDGRDQISVWRATLYFGGWTQLLQNRLRLYYDGFWQPAFGDDNNYRTQIDLGMDFPIWKGLSFNIFYTNIFESVVISGIRQDDKILTFGVGYSLRKR
jgi:hypothetical protein